MAVAWCTECSTFTVSVMLLTVPVVQSRGKFSNPVRRDMDCSSNTANTNIHLHMQKASGLISEYTLLQPENTDYTHS